MKCMEFIRYLLQLCILFVNQLYLLSASYLQIHLKVKYLSIFMPVLQCSRTEIFSKIIPISAICKSLWCVSLTQLFGLEIRLLNCTIHDLSFTGLEWIDTLNSLYLIHTRPLGRQLFSNLSQHFSLLLKPPHLQPRCFTWLIFFSFDSHF